MFHQLLSTFCEKRVGSTSARPTGQHRRADRGSGPPGRHESIRRQDEVERHSVLPVFRLRATFDKTLFVPEPFAKAENDLDYMSDFELVEGALLLAQRW